MGERCSLWLGASPAFQYISSCGHDYYLSTSPTNDCAYTRRYVSNFNPHVTLLTTALRRSCLREMGHAQKFEFMSEVEKASHTVPPRQLLYTLETIKHPVTFCLGLVLFSSSRRSAICYSLLVNPMPSVGFPSTPHSTVALSGALIPHYKAFWRMPAQRSNSSIWTYGPNSTSLNIDFQCHIWPYSMHQRHTIAMDSSMQSSSPRQPLLAGLSSLSLQYQDGTEDLT